MRNVALCSMLTDWVLIARLARELDEALRGARVADAGVLRDGRIAVALRSRGESVTIAVDAFGSPPIVTLERGEPQVAAEPGFPRALGAALRGTVLSAVQARRGDRLLRLTFASRSRFGVGDEVELYLELVPRFGNAVLVKRDTTVAAVKEFSLAENGTRAVGAGLAYQLPPLPAGAPLVPKPLAHAFADVAELDAALEAGAKSGPLSAYLRDGQIVAAHAFPLQGFDDAQLDRRDGLLGVFAELRTARLGRGERERVQRRKDALLKRLRARETKLAGELDALALKRRRFGEREELREEGERIYATLHERAPAERDDAKDRAAKLFLQYKKLAAAQPHVEQREASVRASLGAIESLRWEIDRATDEDVDDVEAAVAALDPRARTQPASGAGARRARKRPPMQWLTPSGSRILVGRNPVQNADLTFRIARPNDLWFHAQGIPGAHVVLARDDRTPPPEEDLETAASLAAFYSTAKNGAKVPVDFTARKHVRKQPDAPPGLVWYTHPRTIVAQPREQP